MIALKDIMGREGISQMSGLTSVEDIERFAGATNPQGAATVQSLPNLTTVLQPMGYIADKMLPTLNVAKMEGYVWQWGSELFDLHEGVTPTGLKWSEGSVFAEVERTISRTSYNLVPYAAQTPTARLTETNDDEAIQRRMANAVGLRKNFANLNEYLVAAALNNTSTFTSVTKSGTSQWWTGTAEGSASDPIADLRTAVTTIHNACGLPPNAVGLSMDAFYRLQTHSSVLAEWRDANPGALPPGQFIADLIMPPDEADGERLRFYIAKAKYESAGEGETSSRQYFWGNDVVIVRNSPTPGRDITTVGYNLALNGWSGRVEEFDSTERAAHIMRMWDVKQAKVLQSECGYVIENAIA